MVLVAEYSSGVEKSSDERAVERSVCSVAVVCCGAVKVFCFFSLPSS